MGNGLGTVLAEKGDLIHAKEAFNRVREVSSDTVPDALLNLGHIYLAQKKHPEALQMYQSYMCRTRSAGTPVTSRSRDEDDAEVLLYVAFAYFDWARQAESFGDTRAAPADERYGKCVEHIELAIKRSKRENVTLRYNWCMSKLQAANCVLQKLTRNIRRTAKEVKDSLEGLEESLPLVQTMLQWKQDGKKIPINNATLQNFLTQCQANIEIAKSHLAQEQKKEAEAQELRQLQMTEAEIQQNERKLRDKVNTLVQNWEQEAKVISNKKRTSKEIVPQAEDNINGKITMETELFDDSDDDSDMEDTPNDDIEVKQNVDKDITAIRGGEEDNNMLRLSAQTTGDREEESIPKPVQQTEKDIFGESSEESEDEMIGSSSKRDNNGLGMQNEKNGQLTKKRRVMDETSD